MRRDSSSSSTVTELIEDEPGDEEVIEDEPGDEEVIDQVTRT